MKSLGALFVLYGLAAMVVHFLGYALVAFDWIGNWGQGVAWGIRAAFVVVGLLFLGRGGGRN